MPARYRNLSKDALETAAKQFPGRPTLGRQDTEHHKSLGAMDRCAKPPNCTNIALSSTHHRQFHLPPPHAHEGMSPSWHQHLKCAPIKTQTLTLLRNLLHPCIHTLSQTEVMSTSNKQLHTHHLFINARSRHAKWRAVHQLQRWLNVWPQLIVGADQRYGVSQVSWDCLQIEMSLKKWI